MAGRRPPRELLCRTALPHEHVTALRPARARAALPPRERAAPLRHEQGRRVYRAVLIVDMRGFGAGHLHPAFLHRVGLYLTATAVTRAVARAYVVNAPALGRGVVEWAARRLLEGAWARRVVAT